MVERCADATVLSVDAALWEPYLAVLQWHPSEATTLLASASLGTRGTVEIRDAGIPVPLTARSPSVHELDMSAVCHANPLVPALAQTESLSEAERLAVGVLGSTELDVERVKASQRRERRPLSGDDILGTLPRWDEAARERGIDYVTYRRLAEALGNVDVPTLRALLRARRPDRAAGLLWPTGTKPLRAD
ncbi:hypothetical protein Air01nite_37280 [Asanoa iriomotensis]|uniref:Uncharacterized protein n=1 Tax=Asanoa iriomotensis TaxID=234613 RepID=A0ABQ4C4B6_9ACTN|nr:hypothetical protein Air01nite_37280 [Asanoa iriomotensis]